MELFFLALLVILMATALGSGFPVAFALPGSAILTIGLAALAGFLVEGAPDAYFAQGGPLNWLSAGVTNFRGIYWEVERDTLIAIPLFVFMGIMLQRSKIAEDLLVSMAQLFGPVRGGLGISVVFVGGLLAATTGILGATVVAMGLISLPAMLRNHYSPSLATGTIAAAGTLGQIIPPSIVLIILADQLSSAVDQASTQRLGYYKETTGEFSMPSEFGVVSTSAGDMFMGALLPGLVLVGLYMLYILVLSFLRPQSAPAMPFKGAFDRAFVARVVLSLVPPLTLIFVVLGSIITGIATVNQAGAIGAAGATIMAGYRLWGDRPRTFSPAIITIASITLILITINISPVNIRQIDTGADQIALIVAAIGVLGFLWGLGWSLWRTLVIEDTLRGVMLETAKTTSLVFIILLGAAMLTAAFRAFGGEDLVREFLTSLPGGFWSQFIIVMAVIFFLGFFLDFIEIAVVVVPIVSPILLADPGANVTAVWLGVMIGLNIQTSFLTPPFGFALFYLRGVAPAVVKTISMYKGVVPYIALQLFALVIVGNFPALVNYIPTRVSLTATTAPPPKNPRLQSCIEDYIVAYNLENGERIRGLIVNARQWDMTGVPTGVANGVRKGLEQADATFDLLEAAFATGAIVDTAAIDYRPLHEHVRAMQRTINSDLADIKRLKKQITTTKRFSSERTDLIDRDEDHIATLTADVAALQAAIPSEWGERRKTFTKLLAEQKKARLAYRRATDGAYEPVKTFLDVLRTADALAALESDVRALDQVVRSDEPIEARESAIQAIEKRISDQVAEAGDINSAIAKVRRAIKRAPDEAMALYADAIATMTGEIAWRTAARDRLLTKVADYEAAIRDTIGLRAQTKMPRTVALEVVACRSHHEDISLHF
ncbi:MAG: TRAP transporter large permease subunit [Alphaproteobacteria bacterium]|nr:TRAP transporter large permease subunit [Alphaproteobacteria bacterium]